MTTYKVYAIYPNRVELADKVVYTSKTTARTVASRFGRWMANRKASGEIAQEIEGYLVARYPDCSSIADAIVYNTKFKGYYR